MGQPSVSFSTVTIVLGVLMWLAFAFTCALQWVDSAAGETLERSLARRHYTTSFGVCGHRVFGSESVCRSNRTVDALRALSNAGVYCSDVDVVQYASCCQQASMRDLSPVPAGCAMAPLWLATPPICCTTSEARGPWDR